MSESTQAARGEALGIGRPAVVDGDVHATKAAITGMARAARCSALSARVGVIMRPADFADKK